MKKAWNRMIALLLCLLMVSLETTSTVQVHAYEPDEDIAAYEDAVVEDLAVEADDETVTFVDFSDQIIQEGGFPEAKDGDQGHSDPDGDELYAVAAGDLAGAQKAIYEGLKKRSESIDVRSYSIKSADAFDVYISVINSHPELFYVKSEATTYSSGITATRIEPKYNSSYTEQDSTAFSNKVNEILAGMDSDWSDLEKALYLHEWIVTHCGYDKTLSKRDAYTVIVGGSAVCQGYALAYEYLLQRAGIDGQVVTSDGINHAWNIISLNNKYYYVDCTWDDPSGADTLHCGHENFLRSRDMMYASESAGGTGHTSTDWIGSEDGMNLYQSVPGDSKYDGYFWSDITHRLPQAGHKTLTIGVTDGNAQGVMYDFGTESSKNYPVETKRWPASWNGGGYWIGYFYRTVAVGDTFYYSDPDSIYSITKDGAQNKVYTLTQVEEGKGYIYGLTAEGNVISYYLKQSPNLSDFTYTGTYTASSSGSIAVTGVALNKLNETISVGESLQLSATVLPSTATNKKVTWKSGNEAIATVTSSGLVKGVGAGETTITVTTADGGKTATCKITVRENQARVELSKNSIKLEKKSATETLTATVYKADGTIDSSAYVSYKSSNTGVAIVSSTGVVTAVANGNATITATSGQMNATCLVTVDIQKTKTPTASPTSGSKIAIGSRVRLSTQTPGAKIYYTLNGGTPSTSSTLYTGPITVSESYAGKTLTIKAIAIKDGYDDSDVTEFSYTVNDSQARIELSKDNIKLEEKDATETLKATVYKADGSKDTSASVSYKSSNTKVATVSQTGVVTAVENGEATITATSGELSATCLVTVEISKEKVEAPTANPASGKKIAIGSSISLSTLTDGAKIYYTLDGSEPSSTKTLYSKPITIEKEYAGQTLKIKAIALKEDFEDSDISEFEYTVDESQARIELSKDSIKFEEKDATEKLTAIVYGADGKEDKEAVVNYRSSNSRIASVSNDGIVTAGENGVATITATYEELTAECIVTVDVKEEEPEPEPEEDKEFKVEGISDGGYPYTGLAITPSVSVYYGDTLLSEGTDYKLGYKNNKLASDGAPEVTVTLAGNYSGTINVPFKILKKNITDQDVVVANTTSVYNGKSQKLKPALYYMGKAVSNKEYRIIGLSSSGYKEPGDYPITFTAELGGNFTGTINTNISIKENTDMIDLAKAAFRLDDPSFSFVYDGNPKEPVYVANGLDRKDYYISYSNNVAIGKATAMISAVPGSGSCYGTKTINFKITKPPVINISNDSNVRISLPDDPVPYAAGGACPKVSVTYAGEPLTEGADYKVSYRNNKNCGQAYVVITGKGAYKGKKEKPFTISKQNLDNLTLIASDVIYSNKIYAYQKTKLTLTDKDGKVLKAGKDYVKFKLGAASEGTVFKSPSSTPEVGSRITVTLTGTGNYTGDITATYYVIEKGKDLSKAKVKILATPEYKDGDPVTLKKEQIQVVFNGKTLSSGDFDIVSYSNNIKAGKGAKVTIRGKGIYGGLKTVGFTIAPKNYK